MYIISGRNVNTVLPKAVTMIGLEGLPISVRGLETVEMAEPVTTQYLNPMERVLFCPLRDANPFFHLMESLWILQGRQDVEWLAQFNEGIRQYSDYGGIFHAPYGYRLKKHFYFNQIEEVCNLLSKDSNTRRAVIQIWDCNSDLNSTSVDIPCNDLVMFKIRGGRLNMTVCNRSNDMIWGAYGANVVQFSMLQEYIAAKIGAEVGHYHQVSDSFHGYTDNPQWKAIQKI